MAAPTLAEQRDTALEHYVGMLSHYGRELGVRAARKHIGWYLEAALEGPSRAALPETAHETLKSWRGLLCRDNNPDQVMQNLNRFYDEQLELAA